MTENRNEVENIQEEKRNTVRNLIIKIIKVGIIDQLKYLKRRRKSPKGFFNAVLKERMFSGTMKIGKESFTCLEFCEIEINRRRIEYTI